MSKQQRFAPGARAHQAGALSRFDEHTATMNVWRAIDIAELKARRSKHMEALMFVIEHRDLLKARDVAAALSMLDRLRANERGWLTPKQDEYVFFMHRVVARRERGNLSALTEEELAASRAAVSDFDPAVCAARHAQAVARQTARLPAFMRDPSLLPKKPPKPPAGEE